MDKLLKKIIPLAIIVYNRFNMDTCCKLYGKKDGEEIWKMFKKQKYANGDIMLLVNNFLSPLHKEIFWKWIESLNLLNIKEIKDLVSTI